jgi:hypothetical protein
MDTLLSILKTALFKQKRSSYDLELAIEYLEDRNSKGQLEINLVDE